MSKILSLASELSEIKAKRRNLRNTNSFGLDVPRGIRNNNPGNIEKNPANAWEGRVPLVDNTDGRFEQFTTYAYGVRALIMLLRTYIKSGKNTITAIFSQYAPPGENNTQQYINFVAGRLGVSASATITLSKNVLRELAQAIAKMENGQECISDAQFEEGFNKLPTNIKTELEPSTTKSFSRHLYNEPAYQYSSSRSLELYANPMSVTVKPVTINVIEDSPNDNGFLTSKAAMTPGALRVKTVEDMVNQILLLLNSDQKIDKLFMYGHGTNGYISIGAGQIPASKQQINGNEEWKSFLEKLKGKFMPGAIVFLGGCHTGAGKEGAEKLKKLADLWGATVSASTGFVYADHEEPGSIHQVAYPDKPTPLPIEPPTTDTKKKEMTKARSFSLTDSNNKISGIYIHPSDKPLEHFNQSKIKITTPSEVNKILSGIDLSKTTNVTGMNGVINARIFFSTDQGAEEYVVFAAYNFLLKKGEWDKAYSVKYELMNELKRLLTDDNRFLNV